MKNPLHGIESNACSVKGEIDFSVVRLNTEMDPNIVNFLFAGFARYMGAHSDLTAMVGVSDSANCIDRFWNPWVETDGRNKSNNNKKRVADG